MTLCGESAADVGTLAPDPPVAWILMMRPRRKPGTAVRGRFETPPKAMPAVEYACATAGSAYLMNGPPAGMPCVVCGRRPTVCACGFGLVPAGFCAVIRFREAIDTPSGPGDGLLQAGDPAGVRKRGVEHVHGGLRHDHRGDDQQGEGPLRGPVPPAHLELGRVQGDLRPP